MKKSLLTLLAFWIAAVATLQASDPFRRHRENAFSAINNHEGSIVFIGNSITHMNEWRESFGVPQDVQILNRGISGAISDEVINNLESYIANKPTKVFLMIGTNDLASANINYPEYPLKNLKKIVERIRKESPNTYIYVQSILPSSVGTRATNIPLTNPLYKEFVEGLNDDHVQWVNLYDQLKNGNTNNMAAGTSLDNLHPNAAGYAIWTRTIKDQIGYEPIYPETLTSIPNGDATYGNQGRAWGMRIGNFYRFKVEADDILLLGDEVFHGSEFHELLGNEKVLGHGTGWGYGSASIEQVKQGAIASLGANTYAKEGVKREIPKQIFFYAGTTDLTGNTTVEDAIAQYGSMLDVVKEKAPTSQIYVLSVIATQTDANKASKITAFNTQLQTLAEEKGVTFVDANGALTNSDGSRIDEYFCDLEYTGYYISGVGYARLAELLATYIDGCTPITVEQARQYKTINDARNALGRVISDVLDLRFDGTAGSYVPEAKGTIDAALETAYAELRKGQESTVEALQACQNTLSEALAAIKEQIVQPKASTEGTTYLYNLTSLRNNRTITSNGTGTGITGEAATKSPRQAWKFVQRDDNSLDIINQADGSYLDPSATYNTQVHTSAEKPAAGWTLKACDRNGYFIITSGSAQLNQSNGTGVLNWGSGSNTNDPGCQYIITETEFPTAQWSTIKITRNIALGNIYGENAMVGRYVLNKETEYDQNNQYWYPLGVTTEAMTPEADDATFYVCFTPNGIEGSRYLRSANGHYLQTNATATLTPTAVAYVTEEDGVRIGATFIPFTNLDNTWGSTTNEDFLVTRNEVTPVDLNAVGLIAWNVILLNATAGANISQNMQVSCTTEGLKGLSKVYDNGTFFIPSATMPEAGDFSVEGYNSTATVNADAKYIIVTVGDVYVDKEEARALLTLQGPGYPTADAPSRAALEAALETDDASAISTAVSAYKTETRVNGLEDGKAYYIVNTQRDGKKYYFSSTAAGLTLVATTSTDGLPESALYIARNENGKTVLVNTLGQYLVFKGSNAGTNSNKGYLDAYNAAQCGLTIQRASTDGATLAEGTTEADFFGKLSIAGKRSDGTTDVNFIIKNDGTFNQAGALFYNNDYSGVFTIVEAADWHNAITWEASESGRYLSTVCLPFAADKGDLTFYGVLTDGTTGAIDMTETEGSVIPAGTPVLLEAAADDLVRLVPAIAPGTEVAENELTTEPTGSVFALGVQNGYAGFFPFSGTPAAGKAYLCFDPAPAVQAFLLFQPVGIHAPGLTDGTAGQPAYDLSGRRVKNPAGGIFVVGREKVLVK